MFLKVYILEDYKRLKVDHCWCISEPTTCKKDEALACITTLSQIFFAELGQSSPDFTLVCRFVLFINSFD